MRSAGTFPRRRPGSIDAESPRCAGTVMLLQMPWMSDSTPPDGFPDVEQALEYPNGLLAAGGDLTPERLLCAYRRGIFPWFSEGQPVLWWTPDPRAVLFPGNLRISRSLRKTLRRGHFALSADHAFSEVIRHCAMPRATERSTWITGEMIGAYRRLHVLGHARSIETWWDGELVGGLYGVAMGRVFFGESMFSRARDASKAALVGLCALGYWLIDCQLPSKHLARLGAVDMPRRAFNAYLEQWCEIDFRAQSGCLPPPSA